MGACSNMWESIKDLPARTKYGFDCFLTDRCGFSPRQRHLTYHWLQLLKDQVIAVIPIAVVQIIVLAAFFQTSINDAGLQVMGLFLAIFGLAMFLDGLRISIMPLAELVGRELPKRLHIAFVLFVAFCLGVLVTYAEPAIASLRPLAKLVDPEMAPYLFFIMNTQTEILVLCIGLGVGVASVLGVIRFIKGWSLKPLIFASLLPTIGLACYMNWGNPDLAPVIPMAWDCGGVTTGPVTVPVLLALGIGVMANTRQQRLARAALEGSVAAGAGQALEGFGIVTLASLWPVLVVELFAIIDAVIYDKEYVLEKAREAAAAPPDDSVIETSPVKEVIYAIRAIMPLVVVLLFIVLVVLRIPLPVCSFWVDPPADEDPSVRDGSVHKKKPKTDLARASSAIAKGLERHDSEASLAESDMTAPKLSNTIPKVSEDPEAQVEAQPGWWARFGAGFRRHLPLIGGVAITQVGMIAFNEGLTYSFTALGDQTGRTLPAAFLTVEGFSKSPYYSYAGGLVLVLVVIFLLGILATKAEPALNVLGRTVERLSGGAFTSRMLISAVCVGVGIGLAAGAAKIIYSLPIIYFILAKYTIASGLTFASEEAITAVAWDSAGVTTGPVTVPFVLSIGIGFSIAVNSPEGFGMLTIASVAPIISVLLTALLRKPAKHARRQLSSKARALGRSVTNMRAMRSMKRSPSMAMAAFASGAGGTAPNTPDSSIRSGMNFGDGDDSVRSGMSFGGADDSVRSGVAFSSRDDSVHGGGEVRPGEEAA